MHISVVAALSIVATLTLSFVAAGSSPTHTPAGTPSPTPTINPTVVPIKPLKCLQKGVVSYCIPNTFKYQVCSPTTKVIECPIGSACKDTTDAKGNKIAYCKFTG